MRQPPVSLRGADQRMVDCPFPMLNKPSRRDQLARMLRELLDAGGDHATNAATRRFAWANGRLYYDVSLSG